MLVGKRKPKNLLYSKNSNNNNCDYRKSILFGNEFNFASGDTKRHSTTLCPSAFDKRPTGIRDVYPTGFHNLPVKVLIKIFKYFDENQLRKCIMPVCRKWKRVAQLPELWQNLNFKGDTIPSGYMCKQIRVFCQLQSVRLFNVPNVVPIIRQLCRCVPGITSVGIKECSDSQPDGKLSENVLRNLVASCKKLKEIDLKGTQFIGDLFYLEVGILPDLKSINLSKNQFVNGKNLIELVLNCRFLEEFKLTKRFKNQKISDSDVSYLFLNLKKTLRTLSFDGIGLPDSSFKIIPACTNLERLVLYNAMNLGIDTFLEIGNDLQKLKCLKIQKLTIPSSAYRTFFSKYQKNLRHLTNINFSDCWKFDSVSLEALSICCINLEKLNIKNCNQVEHLKPLSEYCKKLNSVNLAFCIKINDDAIFELVKGLSSLRRLLLHVSTDERGHLLEDLSKNFPNLDIVVSLSEFNKNHLDLKDYVQNCHSK